MENDRPKHKESIHGHPVYCDDRDVRQYLKQLDSDEAGIIFSAAKNRGRAEFEFRKAGSTSRYNCTMEYDDGAYIVLNEGRETAGWF
ncbi:MAG: hypothetical protein HY340_00420 [Candidatus Kerfeldbacteria bacterium]|nr:hypothetical protein [Candidatus Kerfeldbacteria bacterium]